MNLRYIILLSLISFLFVSCGGGYGGSGNNDHKINSSAEITETDVLRHIKYLASDELNGRRTGTPGGVKAAEYIASEFKRLGLSPVDDDEDYLQPFEFASGAELGSNNSLTAEADGEIIVLTHEVDFRPFQFSTTNEVEGDLVFAGYGISVSDSSYDDYADIDVDGKIALVLRYVPELDNQEKNFRRYGSLFYKLRNAREHGAVAIMIVTGIADDSTDSIERFSYARYFKSGIIAITISREATNKFLRSSGKTIDELQREILDSKSTNSQSIPGVTLSISSEVVPQYSEGFNVMALLEGNDPSLKEDLFVIGAHYDHLGIGGSGSRAPDKYGEVHNGADDNASGTAGMLELAEYFSANRKDLHHSILFQAYAAEESGLLGSRHYVDNPLMPLKNTYAMMNIDMIGRDKDTSVVMNGMANSPIWDGIVEEANKEVSMKIITRKQGGGSSDHASFNLKEIPNIFFFTGTHEDYHKPSDDWEKINLEGEVRILQLARNMAWGLDRVDEKPLFVKKSGHGSSGSPRMSFRVVLGVTPDYAYENEGLKILGVREGGTASVAGIESGDVIVKMGEIKILSIEDYMTVLQELKPGTVIMISVMRGEEVIELSAKMQSP